MNTHSLDLNASIEWVRSGKILAHPTESIWGLGCDAFNEDAVNKIFKMKRRSKNKSFILLSESLDFLKKYIQDLNIKDEKFCMELILPISLGTVGGLTKLHPMANWCLELLGNPSAEELMEIVAVAGLAQNFAALRSLITSGIQNGHMKMHLTNILNQLQANENQKLAALKYFDKRSE